MKISSEVIIWDGERYSECCDAPLLHYENELGICSDCKEWASKYPHCDTCGYEWSGCLGDDELPDTCECGGNVDNE